MSTHLKLGSGNHLLRNAAGHLVIDCGSVEPTCDINCTTMASAYTILGVNSLAGCAACLSSTWPQWNGVMEYTGGCQWQLNTIASLSGKRPSFSSGIGGGCPIDHSSNGVGIWYNRDDCRWELAITCITSTLQYWVIWAGTKTVEFSPAGVYQRVCGCDETPTLTVV